MIIPFISAYKIYNINKINKISIPFGKKQMPKDTFVHQNFFPAPRLPKREQLLEGSVFDSYKSKKISDKELIEMVKTNPSSISDHDYNLFAQNNVILTEFDTPEVIEKRRKFATSKAEELVDEETNNAVIQKELDKLKSVPSKGKMVIVCGLAGSGKNTYIQQKHLDKNYYLADVDVVKDSYRELLGDDTYHKYDFHPQSRYIMQERVLKEAFEQRKNIVLPTTGMLEYIERLSELCSKYKYKIDIVMIDTNLENSIQRSLKRQEKDGFFTDPVFVYKRNQENKDLTKNIYLLTFWEHFSIYNNNTDNFILTKCATRRPKFGLFSQKTP